MKKTESGDEEKLIFQENIWIVLTKLLGITEVILQISRGGKKGHT